MVALMVVMLASRSADRPSDAPRGPAGPAMLLMSAPLAHWGLFSSTATDGEGRRVPPKPHTLFTSHTINTMITSVPIIP
jgi:hypothetical protein